MHSERPEHRMYEQWHPLGVVGIISAFNFGSGMVLECNDRGSVWKRKYLEALRKNPFDRGCCFEIISKVLKSNDLNRGFLTIIGDVVAGNR